MRPATTPTASLSVEAAVEHNTLGALLDPRDITFLINRAAAYFRIGKVSPGSRSPSIPSLILFHTLAATRRPLTLWDMFSTRSA